MTTTQIMMTHFRYVMASAWRHSKPKVPFLPRADWIHIGGGVVFAAIVAAFVGQFSQAGVVLLNVGSFVGALASVLPSHHGRITSVVVGIGLVDAGTVVGLLLQNSPVLALLILFVGLFMAGMARAISVGASLRLIFAAIAVCSAAELAHAASSTTQVWQAFGAFVLGQVIVAICACMGRSHQTFTAQRDATAELYRQLIALGQGKPARFVRAHTLANESIELITLLEFTRSRWLRTLVAASDDIAAQVPMALHTDDIAALRWILAVLQSKAGQPLPADLDLSPGVALAVKAAKERRSRSKGRTLLRTMYPYETARFYLGELKDVRGATLRFALRIAVTGVICQAVGQFLLEDFGRIPFHGFWTLLAGVLMVMPDYHGTIGKATARTFGSIIGALVGTALSLLPLLQTRPGFLVVITLFVLGYLAARTVSQGVLMIVIVGWLAFLLGGEAAAFTRTLDTIVASVVVGVVFFILPTWHVDRLHDLFAQWCACARSAFAAVVARVDSQADLSIVSANPENRERRIALTKLSHSHRRFAQTTVSVPMEPRSNESPWPVTNLPAIVDAMDRINLAILQLQYADDLVDVNDLQRYTDWFSALEAGRIRPGLQQPPGGPLHSLWIELDRLETLILNPRRDRK